MFSKIVYLAKFRYIYDTYTQTSYMYAAIKRVEIIPEGRNNARG